MPRKAPHSTTNYQTTKQLRNQTTKQLNTYIQVTCGLHAGYREVTGGLRGGYREVTLGSLPWGGHFLDFPPGATFRNGDLIAAYVGSRYRQYGAGLPVAEAWDGFLALSRRETGSF